MFRLKIQLVVGGGEYLPETQMVHVYTYGGNTSSKVMAVKWKFKVKDKVAQ